MLSTIVRVALTVLTIGTLESLRRQLAARPAGTEPEAQPPHEESTWEGEGGALPTTGSHLGADPAV